MGCKEVIEWMILSAMVPFEGMCKATERKLATTRKLSSWAGQNPFLRTKQSKRKCITIAR